MIGVMKDREGLDALEAQARETGNMLALEALELVQTVLMARHSLMMHIEKERGLRLRYQAGLMRARGWARPSGKRKSKLTKEDLIGIVENMSVEIISALGDEFDAAAV